MNKIKFNILLKLKKYGSMYDLTEEQQQILFDNMQDFTMEEKIYYFKEYNYKAPFKNINKDEYEKLIFGNELNLNEIVLLIMMREDYDKLEEIKWKNPNAFDRLKHFGFGFHDQNGHDYWFKVVIGLYNYYSFIYETGGERIDRKIDREFKDLLFEKININGKEEKIYDVLLNNPLLKRRLIKACFKENTSYHTKDNLMKDHEKINLFFCDNLTVDQKDLYLKLLEEKEYKDKLFDEEKLKYNPIWTDDFYENLPNDKKKFMGLKYISYDDKEHWIEMYKKYYPELSSDSIDLIVHLQMCTKSRINMLYVLESYEKDNEYINKLMKLNNMFKGNSEYISSFGIKYPILFNEVVSLDSITDELKEKIDYLLTHNKFKGIDTLDDLNKLTMEELSKAKFDLFEKQNKSGQIPTSPNAWGSKVEGTFVEDGPKGVIQIKQNGETNINGAYEDYAHVRILRKLYKKDSKDEDSMNVYIEIGIKNNDIVILYEKEMVMIFAPECITQVQLEKIIDLIENSKISDKLNISYEALSNKDDGGYALKDGDFMKKETFFEQCNHINIVSNEDTMKIA